MNTTLVNSVRFKIKNKLGLEDVITIRELTIRELYQFINHFTSEQTPALVGLCTDRSGEWIDFLDLDSYGALAQECIKLNFTKATTIAMNDPIVAVKMAPFFTKVSEMLRQIPESASWLATAGTIGATPSPTPAPAGAAAATGSPAST